MAERVRPQEVLDFILGALRDVAVETPRGMYTDHGSAVEKAMERLNEMPTERREAFVEALVDFLVWQMAQAQGAKLVPTGD